MWILLLLLTFIAAFLSALLVFNLIARALGFLWPGAYVSMLCFSFAAALVFSVICISYFPNHAGLERNIHGFFGYSSTRIDLLMRTTDEKAKNDLLAEFVPVMLDSTRFISVSVPLNRYGTARAVERSMVPTYYRFSDKTMEIATGRKISKGVEGFLKIIAKYPEVNLIPEKVAATLELSDKPIPITLLPRSTTFRDARANIGIGEYSNSCALKVNVLVPIELWPNLIFLKDMDAIGYTAGSGIIISVPGAQESRYEVLGLAAPIKELASPAEFMELISSQREEDSERRSIHMSIFARAIGGDGNTSICFSPDSGSNGQALAAAAIYFRRPNLNGLVREVKISTDSFSSRKARGWTAAPRD